MGLVLAQPGRDPFDDGKVSMTLLEERFRALRDAWKQSIAPMCDECAAVQHPAYREIISLGEDAVPLIIAELRNAPDPWFEALAEITDVDPAQCADTVEDAAAYWISWFDGKTYWHV